MSLEQQFFDRLTRLDELMEENTEAIRTLVPVLKAIVPAIKTLDFAELRRKVESGQWTPYEIKSFSLTSARTNELVEIEGDFIHAWTDGVLDGIGVRYNNENNGLVYFKRRNPVSGFPFWKLWLTNGAQSGKTLDLMIGREASAQAMTAEVSVSMTQYFYTLRSDKDSHFTGGINQNAKEDEDLTGLLSDKIRITGIALQSDQNLDYKVLFWKTDGFDDTDLDVDKFCGEIEVDLPTYGHRIGAANQYYLDVRLPAGIDYEDEDATKELHVSLMNLSATAKNSGATGEVTIEIFYEPRS